MYGIIELHNYIFFFLVIILYFVVSLLFNILKSFYFFYNYDKTLTQFLNNEVSGKFLLQKQLIRDLLNYKPITHGTLLEII